MNARILRGIAATAVALAVVRPGPAVAGQEVLPPGTVTLGPLRITPTLALSDMGIDDNVFNEPDDPKRDFTFTITPKAALDLRIRRLKLTSTLATDYVYYQQYTSERGTNTFSSAKLELELGRLKPYGSVQGADTKSRLNSEVDARARHHDLLYGAGVSFKLASRTSVVVNGTQAKVVYEPDQEFRGVDLDQSFNGRRRTVDAGLDFALTPITNLTVSVANEQQRFQFSPDRDSDAWRVSPMFTFSPIGVLGGTASVGYRSFKPVSPTLPAYKGLVSAVNINATIYGRHQLLAQFNRDVQYSYDLDNDYYIGTGGTLTWTWLLFGPIDVRATGGRLLMDYRGGPLPPYDTSSTYGGGVGYRFGARARLGANILVTRRKSNDRERGYRNQRLFVGLTWGTIA